MIPVLVFDQFEEIFTLGRRGAGTPQRVEQLLVELESLVECRPPPALQARLDANPVLADRYEFDKNAVKVILSLREDFLPELEGLGCRLRPITYNRYRLQQLRGDRALEAVLNPGAKLLEEKVAIRIVDFVSAGRTQRGAACASREDLAQRFVQPAYLSVFCRELNQRRLRRGQAGITEDLLSGSKEEIIRAFYERSVADLDPRVRAYIEDALITGSGFRDRDAVEDALRVPGVTREALQALIDRRILHREESAGAEWIELTHDLLTDVVLAGRTERTTREAQSRARAAEEAAQRSRGQVRRLRAMVLTLWALLVAFAIAGVMFWNEHGKERRARTRAEAAESKLESERDNARRERDKARELEQAAESMRDQADKLTFSMIHWDESVTPGVPPLFLLELNQRVLDHYAHLPTNRLSADQYENWIGALNKRGFILQQARNYADALDSYTNALRLAEQQLRSSPTNIDCLALASLSQRNIAGIMKALHRDKEARTWYERAMETAERIPEAGSGGTYRETSLYSTSGEMGDFFFDQADYASAEKVYQRMLEIGRRRASGRSEDGTDGLYYLAIALEKVGRVNEAGGVIRRRCRTSSRAWRLRTGWWPEAARRGSI